jgi:hypothetical protein
MAATIRIWEYHRSYSTYLVRYILYRTYSVAPYSSLCIATRSKIKVVLKYVDSSANVECYQVRTYVANCAADTVLGEC